MALAGLGIAGRLTLEIGVGKIIKGYSCWQREEIVDTSEKGLLNRLLITHKKIGCTIEPHQGNSFKVDIDKFAKSATVLKPAPSGQFAPRTSHAPDNTSQGAGTLTCVHADRFQQVGN